MDEKEAKFYDIAKHLRTIGTPNDEIITTLQEQGCKKSRAQEILNEIIPATTTQSEKALGTISTYSGLAASVCIVALLIIAAIFYPDIFGQYFPVILCVVLLSFGYAAILFLFTKMYSEKYDYKSKPSLMNDLVFGTMITVVSFILLNVYTAFFIIILAVFCFMLLLTAYKMVPTEAILAIIIIVGTALLFKQFLPSAIELMTYWISLL